MLAGHGEVFFLPETIFSLYSLFLWRLQHHVANTGSMSRTRAHCPLDSNPAWQRCCIPLNKRHQDHWWELLKFNTQLELEGKNKLLTFRGAQLFWASSESEILSFFKDFIGAKTFARFLFVVLVLTVNLKFFPFDSERNSSTSTEWECFLNLKVFLHQHKPTSHCNRNLYQNGCFELQCPDRPSSNMPLPKS